MVHPIIGVMGSGQAATRHEQRAVELGKWLATQNVHLLTGGQPALWKRCAAPFTRCPGAEGWLSASFHRARLIPRCPNTAIRTDGLNCLSIYTHLPLSAREGAKPLSRNHINVLSSAVIIALPGGDGTRSEIMLALKYKPGAVAAYLDEPSDIPRLPKEVPVYRKLRDIQNFFRSIVKI
jgi:SLOG cluster4 family